MLQGMTQRAKGALLGQLAGDALGSLVEFQTPSTIAKAYPSGVRRLEDGGTWDTIAGQPTDDSELALALARTLVRDRCYHSGEAFKAYASWLASGPFDVGGTISAALRGQKNPASQANGALMRVSPLAIFSATVSAEDAMAWAADDAELTHPHAVCVDINRVFVAALARAVRTDDDGPAIFAFVEELVGSHAFVDEVVACVAAARRAPPADMTQNMGWVVLAFQNALHHLLHASNVEDALVQTIAAGGDTDTNAAICGALLGGVFGCDAMPEAWTHTLRDCRPAFGRPGVLRPRPPEYWPVDFEALAAALLEGPT